MKTISHLLARLLAAFCLISLVALPAIAGDFTMPGERGQKREPITFNPATSGMTSTLLGILPPPQGRLTLTSGTPVLSADVSAATTVYYTPYTGRLVPTFDGTNFAPKPFSELSFPLDTTNYLSGKNFDVFVGGDSPIIRACSGPAWSSDTSRGTGAGTTELERKFGILVNKNSMTCRYGASSTFTCAVDLCTYVGSFRTSANGQTELKFQTGQSRSVLVWNMYNRVAVSVNVREATSSWTYNSTTVRSSNNSTTNRVTFLSGLAEDGINASWFQKIDHPTNSDVYTGFAMDSTSAFDVQGSSFLGNEMVSAVFSYAPQLGLHYIQTLESTGANSTLYGSTKSGLTVELRG